MQLHTRNSTAERVFSLDVARGLAIFAMIIAHTNMFINPMNPLLSYVGTTLNALAAPLFALVIGVTIAVAGPSSSGSAQRSSRQQYRRQMVLRALVLIVLGVALDLLPSGVNIVLDYLGVAMLLLIPMLFLTTRTVLVIAASLLVLIPAIVTVLRVSLSTPLNQAPLPVYFLLDWTFLGISYQALNFLTLMLIGLALGRGAMQNKTLLLRLLLVGPIFYLLLEAWRLVARVPEFVFVRGGFSEVLREVALTLTAFSLLLLILNFASEKVQDFGKRVLGPLATMGRMALSLYILHLFLIAFTLPKFGRSIPADPAYGYAIQLLIVVSCWAFAAIWWRLLGAGPMERLIGVLSGRHPFRSLWQTKK